MDICMFLKNQCLPTTPDYLSDYRLGSPADQERKTAFPAINQRARGCQQLWQRVHKTAAGPVASTQTLQPLRWAAGSLRRLWLLRLARMKSELKRQRMWRTDQQCFYRDWKVLPTSGVNLPGNWSSDDSLCSTKGTNFLNIFISSVSWKGSNL